MAMRIKFTEDARLLIIKPPEQRARASLVHSFVYACLKLLESVSRLFFSSFLASRSDWLFAVCYA